MPPKKGQRFKVMISLIVSAMIILAAIALIVVFTLRNTFGTYEIISVVGAAISLVGALGIYTYLSGIGTLGRTTSDLEIDSTTTNANVPRRRKSIISLTISGLLLIAGIVLLVIGLVKIWWRVF
jgi:hypothetical protein